MVKRYDVSVANREPRTIYILSETPTPDGKYVLHSDYLSLESRCKELEEALGDVIERWEGLHHICVHSIKKSKPIAKENLTIDGGCLTDRAVKNIAKAKRLLSGKENK